MKNIRKFILVSFLLWGVSVFSFGEILITANLGYYRFSDIFFSDDYGRDQNGVNSSISFYVFSEEHLLGFFAQTSFGSFISGSEWQGDERPSSLDDFSRSDLRICLAPSYKLQLNPKVAIPFVLGPVFSFYWENGYGSWPRYSDYRSSYYEAINMGIMGDASVVLYPYEMLALKFGLCIGYDFLHAEKGEMRTAYRYSLNNRLNVVPYSAIGLSLFFGAGIYFE